MDKLFEWMMKNKKKIILFIVLMMVGPMIVTHLLFKWRTGCYWIEAEWEAGEMLGYFASVLSFLPTVVLGYATLMLNDKANKQNDKLIKMQYNQQKSIVVFDQTRKLLFFTLNKDPILLDRLNKRGVDINLDYIDNGYTTNDIMIMEIWLKNVTDNFVAGIELEQFDIVICDEDNEVYCVKPKKGLGEELSIFIGEKENEKVRFILTGLKSFLPKEKWEVMQYEFEIRCLLSIRNVYGQITQVYFETGIVLKANDEKIGKREYTIFNYNYKEVDCRKY